jgi:hypothetical protein
MAIREEQANARIDAAIAVLAAGSDAPASPDRVRDPVLNGVVRLEWIADTLETISAGESGEDAAAMLGRQTRDELNAHAAAIGIENPESYRTKAELVEAIVTAQGQDGEA